MALSPSDALLKDFERGFRPRDALLSRDAVYDNVYVAMAEAKQLRVGSRAAQVCLNSRAAVRLLLCVRRGSHVVLPLLDAVEVRAACYSSV
jgi:hypothetical protein